MKPDSSDDEPRDLTSLSTKQILDFAQKESTKEKDESKLSVRTKIANFIGSEGAGATLLSWCVFALLMDPLFLYIPLIHEDKKCFTLDRKLKIIALVLRSITDLPFALANILLLGSVILLWPLWLINFSKVPVFKRCIRRAVGRAMVIVVKYHLWDEEEVKDYMFHDLLFLSRFAVFLTLAAYPIPQIAVLVLFPQIGGSTYLIGTEAILLQYALRAWPTYYYCQHFNKGTLKRSKNKRWIPGLVNFALYILASHIVGALWYFFSILQETNCWRLACQKEIGCEFRTFYCDSEARTTFKNITRVNELCPINPLDATVSKFGIFAGPIQSGLVGSTDFLKKLLQGFSWGLRNLSSFASNLNGTTNDTGEILFVIFVSISGLVLFMYLLGNMQAFMQSYTSTRRIHQKIQAMTPEIEIMVHEYGLPAKFIKVIAKLVKRELKKDEDLVVENIFSKLPTRLQDSLKRHLFWDTLRNMPRLRDINYEEVLKAILKDLKPVNYAAGNYIIREGEPLDMIFSVAQGAVLTFQANVHCGGSTRDLAKRDFYGEELITWAETQGSSLFNLPISTKTVKCHEKVEVFVIKAAGLKQIVSKCSALVEITDIVHSSP